MSRSSRHGSTSDSSTQATISRFLSTITIWDVSSKSTKNNAKELQFRADYSKRSTISELAARGFQRIKTIKHESCLQFVEGKESSTHIRYTTESCIPLSIAKYGMHPNEIVYGLYSIINGLQFLTQMKLFFLNFSENIIFVTESRDWKFGCFELLVRDDEATNIIQSLNSTERSALFRCLPKEMCRSSFHYTPDIHNQLISWQLGSLMASLFYIPESSEQTSQSNGLPLIPPSLAAAQKMLTSPLISQRPSLSLLQTLVPLDVAVESAKEMLNKERSQVTIEDDSVRETTTSNIATDEETQYAQSQTELDSNNAQTATSENANESLTLNAPPTKLSPSQDIEHSASSKSSPTDQKQEENQDNSQKLSSSDSVSSYSSKPSPLKTLDSLIPSEFKEGNSFLSSQLLSGDSSNIPSFCTYFSHSLPLHFQLFCDNLILKSEYEKEEMLKALVPSPRDFLLSSFSPDVLRKKILPVFVVDLEAAPSLFSLQFFVILLSVCQKLAELDAIKLEEQKLNSERAATTEASMYYSVFAEYKQIDRSSKTSISSSAIASTESVEHQMWELPQRDLLLLSNLFVYTTPQPPSQGSSTNSVNLTSPASVVNGTKNNFPIGKNNSTPGSLLFSSSLESYSSVKVVSSEQSPFVILSQGAYTRLPLKDKTAIREVLIDAFPSFSALIPDNYFQSSIFPAILSGFSDPSVSMRELTLKAMAPCAAKVTPSVVKNVILRNLAQLQGDAETRIRANTILCISMIAPHLPLYFTDKKSSSKGSARSFFSSLFSSRKNSVQTENTESSLMASNSPYPTPYPSEREIVLLGFFMRALADKFVLVRMAALNALAGMLSLFSLNSLSLKIIPAISQLCAYTVTEEQKISFSKFKREKQNESNNSSFFDGISSSQKQRLDRIHAQNNLRIRAIEVMHLAIDQLSNQVSSVLEEELTQKPRFYGTYDPSDSTAETISSFFSSDNEEQSSTTTKTNISSISHDTQSSKLQQSKNIFNINSISSSSSSKASSQSSKSEKSSLGSQVSTNSKDRPDSQSLSAVNSNSPSNPSMSFQNTTADSFGRKKTAIEDVESFDELESFLGSISLPASRKKNNSPETSQSLSRSSSPSSSDSSSSSYSSSYSTVSSSSSSDPKYRHSKSHRSRHKAQNVVAAPVDSIDANSDLQQPSKHSSHTSKHAHSKSKTHSRSKKG